MVNIGNRNTQICDGGAFFGKVNAKRYGLDAELVDTLTHEMIPARTLLRQLVEKLRPNGQELGCADELEDMLRMAGGPTWAEKQMRQKIALDAGMHNDSS